MTTPRTKAARRTRLEELAAVAAEISALDQQRDRLAETRDRLLLEARKEDPNVSLRDVAAVGNVSHAWVRKLEVRAG